MNCTIKKLDVLDHFCKPLFAATTIAVVAVMMSGCGGGGGGSTSAGTSSLVQGTVAAPGGSLTSDAKAADGTNESTTSETGVSGLTVEVGTIATTGSSGSATFTEISGATTTSGSDGTFSVTLPSGTSITSNTVVIAFSGTAPTTLPSSGVLVSPILAGTKALVDPVTTAATTYLCQQAATDGVPIANLSPPQVQSYLASAENASMSASIPPGCTFQQMQQIIITSISGSSTTGITLSGAIVGGQPNRPAQGQGGTLTSGASFTTGTDSSGASFNGTSTEFTAANVGVMPQGSNIQIVGNEPPTSSTPGRTFQIVFPGTAPITPGTYAATITYCETPVPTTIAPVPTSQSQSPGVNEGFGPGDQFLAGGNVSLWTAQSVTVTLAAGSSTSSPLSMTINSATYSPSAGANDKTNAAGTFTTDLTGTVGPNQQ